jgi:YesN/AraC family two-component response regulator
MEVRIARIDAEDHPIVMPPNSEIENTTLGLIVKFKRLMAEEKPYLEAGLTLDDMCKKLNTNRTYLSQMIHDNFNQNFNGYLNELRIKEARRLLTESKYDHLSIEGIGEMVGFRNKVTFHSIFKKYIGVTPSYFRGSVALGSAPANE